MVKEKEAPIYDFVYALSEAIDLVSPVINSHHRKVAYVSYRIAHEMQLPANEIQDIVLAAMLYDRLGYKLLKGFTPLARAARLIKHHNIDYEKSSYNIPMGSCIIHLADQVCALFDEQSEILNQVPYVLEKIAEKNHKFHPDALISFGRLAKQEGFWLEVFSQENVVSKKNHSSARAPVFCEGSGISLFLSLYLWLRSRGKNAFLK